VTKREKIFFRVVKGGLQPADPYAASCLRERNYKIGDLLKGELTKPRNPKFNRLVHGLGKLVVANIESFAGMDAHRAIKRLQIEGKVACDEIGVMVPGYGMVIQFIPRSFSFESMDEAEYNEAAKGISRTIAARYWPGMSVEQIEAMAEVMINE
jgi:hypothetical protein